MTPRQRIERLKLEINDEFSPPADPDVIALLALIDEWEQKWRLVARYASQPSAAISLSADAIALLDKESL